MIYFKVNRRGLRKGGEKIGSAGVLAVGDAATRDLQGLYIRQSSTLARED